MADQFSHLVSLLNQFSDDATVWFIPNVLVLANAIHAGVVLLAFIAALCWVLVYADRCTPG